VSGPLPAGVAEPAAAAPQFDTRPLYAQVEAVLVGRIAEGSWPPGCLLPSEAALAQELGVSPGTVRKAMAALERRHLVERRQGRGTFVARHTSERARFHFFRFTDRKGRKVTPTSIVLTLATAAANEAERRALELPVSAVVHRMVRLRLVDGVPAILERIQLPETRFPGFTLPLDVELKRELYVHYQREYLVSVARAVDQLSSAAASAAEGEALVVRKETPLLRVERVAHDVGGRPVERRVSLVRADLLRYRVELA
jgi:GntR family transcriptional regulator